MKGDFSRDRFEARKRYSSVRMQQGRVHLDSDWNEQADIQAYIQNTSTKDKICCCGVPRGSAGFQINLIESDTELSISPGRIYVNGILCEFPSTALRISSLIDGTSPASDRVELPSLVVDGREFEAEEWVEIFADGKVPKQYKITSVDTEASELELWDLDINDWPIDNDPQLRRVATYLSQPDYPHLDPIAESEEVPISGRRLAYLDVWQRHISWVEDDELLEPALNGVDTTTRTKTIWQVKLLSDTVDEDSTCSDFDCDKLRQQFALKGRLAARSKPTEETTDPCTLTAKAGYSGLENQLYRVEIHVRMEEGSPVAYFKWSRDNGSIVARWTGQPDPNNLYKLTVSSTGRDHVLGFRKNDWVELTDDTRELRGEPGVMTRIDSVDNHTIVLNEASIKLPDDSDAVLAVLDLIYSSPNPKIRRWDSDGLISIDENLPPDSGFRWLELENGVEISFEKDGEYFRAGDATSFDRTGDYWLIPARTITGDVIWPVVENGNEDPLFKESRGIKHDYCSLALIDFGTVPEDNPQVYDCRPTFPKLTQLTNHIFHVGGNGQEVMPNLGGSLVSLPESIRVGVSQGTLPLKGRKIRFEVTDGSGELDGSSGPQTVLTDADGVAVCNWSVDSVNPTQWVEATLIDDFDQPLCALIHFHANLSMAREVRYDPAACSNLTGQITVQEAIDTLCQIQGGGCATAVAPGVDLATALNNAQPEDEIHLCLMPGIHEISSSINVGVNPSIKIIGAGHTSVVRLSGADVELNMHAQQLRLQDIKFDFVGASEKMVLAGESIITGCVFERNIGSDTSPPLLLVQPAGSALWMNTLRFKNNRMVAKIPAPTVLGLVDPPAHTLPIPIEVALQTLSEKDAIEERSEFDTELDTTTDLVVALSVQDRQDWYDAKPTIDINMNFSGWRKEAFERFYENLIEDPIDTQVTRATLETLFSAVIYLDALTLDPGVWGWIEDNVIEGNLCLLNEPNFMPLEWILPYDNKVTLEEDMNFDEILVGEETLALEGNDFFSVRSSSYALMNTGIINDFLRDGDWEDGVVTPGYKSLSVRDNLFRDSRNSFICESMRMSGNQFPLGIYIPNVVAFVLGYYGTFTGNLAPEPADPTVARIEKILTRMRESANLITIE